MSATSCCRAWRTSPSCARRTRMRASSRSTSRRGEEGAGRDRRRHRRRAGQGDDAVGRRADASQGPEIGAAARHRRRARLLAGRGRVRRGRAHARAGRGRLRTGRGRPTRSCRRSPIAETALDPKTPVIHAVARRQSLLRAQARGRRGRQGLRRSRRGGRDDLRHRPPHRRHQRAARRSSPTGTQGEQRLTVYQGTQAPHMMQDLFAKHLGLQTSRCASSPRTSAARSASRCTPTPTRWRRWRCRSCSSGR